MNLLGPDGKPIGKQGDVLDAQGLPAGAPLAREAIDAALSDERVIKVTQLLVTLWGCSAFLRQTLQEGSRHSPDTLNMVYRASVDEVSRQPLSAIDLIDDLKRSVIPALDAIIAPARRAGKKAGKEAARELQRRKQQDLVVKSFAFSVPRNGTLVALDIDDEQNGWQLAALVTHQLLCENRFASFLCAEEGNNLLEAKGVCFGHAVPLPAWFNAFGEDESLFEKKLGHVEALVVHPYGFLYPKEHDKKLRDIAAFSRRTRVPVILAGAGAAEKAEALGLATKRLKAYLREGTPYIENDGKEYQLILNPDITGEGK